MWLIIVDEIDFNQQLFFENLCCYSKKKLDFVLQTSDKS